MRMELLLSVSDFVLLGRVWERSALKKIISRALGVYIVSLR